MKERIEDEYAKWRRNPAYVIRCPHCSGLGGLHAKECPMDPRNDPETGQRR
jgi:hypothetical protein